MNDLRTTDPDQLFTMAVSLMWQLHAAAGAQGVPWAADDLLTAIGELELGPWRHLGSVPDLDEVPFTVACTVLDLMLNELRRVSPSLGARVAVAKAQSWLDPDAGPG